MPSILFVCTGNIYRSPFAAAAFLQLLKNDGKDDGWKVSSAGTWTESGRPVSFDAIQIAHKFGLSMDGHISHMITSTEISDNDLVLVMEEGQKEALLSEFAPTREKVYLLSEVTDHIPYNIPDPAAGNVDLEQVYREIYELINKGYSLICQMLYKE